MPNHVHGILWIDTVNEKSIPVGFVGTQHVASLQSQTNAFGPQSQNLASIIRGFKIGVTKYANEHDIAFAWQPRFYDHIIRDERSLHQIREYIRDNPKNWEKDKENEEGLYM